jgi:DNA replication initiation complex subunit (GINS family)
MTLSEEDFYKRFQNALDGHAEFVRDSLAGTPSTKKKKKKKKREKKEPDSASESDDIDYVYVRFLREIEDQVMGLDERTYGPFKKESVAKLPAANVSHWLRDGTVVRFVPEEDIE